MKTSPARPAAPDPLFPGGVTLPLSEVGGVRYPLAHEPGNLRPFVATLAVPAPPVAKKHDTANTRNSTTDTTYNQPDGEGGKTDTITDTTTDT